MNQTGRRIPAITAATDDPIQPEEAGGIGECSTSLWDFAEKEPNHEARATAKSPARRHLPFRLSDCSRSPYCRVRHPIPRRPVESANARRALRDFAGEDSEHHARAAAKSLARRHLPFRLSDCSRSPYCRVRHPIPRRPVESANARRALRDFAGEDSEHHARAAAKSLARRHLPFRRPATAINAEPFPPSPVTT